MDPAKNSILLGMFEELRLTRFPSLRSSARSNSERQLMSATKKNNSSVLSTIRRLVKLDHTGYPTTGSAFIRKWRGSRRNGSIPEEDDLNSKEEPGCSDETQWCTPPQDFFAVEFCQDTSLHGLKYIGQPQRHISERIFWFLMFILGLSVAVWLISEMWNKYKMNPVIVSFQPFETNVDQVPFPAVTICNMNKVMRSKAEEFIRGAQNGDPQALKDLYYLNHVCSATQSFSRRFNFTNQNISMSLEESEKVNAENLTRVNGFLRRAAQNCTEMIRLCVWHDQETDCSQLFRPIETEFGKCCTFNMVPLSLLYTKRNDSRETEEEILQWQKWDIDNDGLLLSGSQEIPRRQMKAGLTNGLSFLLNLDSKEYYCTNSDSLGWRMATHLPIELPKIADFGFSVLPKAEIFVDVIPQITMVDQDVFAFSLDKRKCYKTGEFKLAHYKYYSVKNCIAECIANETRKGCGCKRYYMPRNVSEPLCGPRKFECAEEAKYNKTKNGIRNECSMCLQSCTEVDYEPQVTTTPLRKGIWKFENGTSPEWNENDLSIVHVYIGQDSFYAKVRKELYGPTDLFANTGGLMGLCLGFSGLSLVEVIYFLTLRAWWKRKRSQQVVTTEDVSKWAKPSITPITSAGLKRKSSNDEQKKGEQTKPLTYYRSIFGELRDEDKR